MPVIVTALHDAAALRVTCLRSGLAAPRETSVWIGDFELRGWAVPLGGLQASIVCSTLTGLIAYHQRDNEFHRYRRIMRFVHRYYDVRAQMQRPADDCRSRSFALRHQRNRFVARRVA
jgi:hypothetical protein